VAEVVAAVLARAAEDVVLGAAVVEGAEVLLLAVAGLVATVVAREALLVPALAPAPPHAARPIAATPPSPATSSARRDRRDAGRLASGMIILCSSWTALRVLPGARHLVTHCTK